MNLLHQTQMAIHLNICGILCLKPGMWTSWWCSRKSQGTTKVIWLHHLGTTNICTKSHDNPSNSCWNISVWTLRGGPTLPFLEAKMLRRHWFMVITKRCGAQSTESTWCVVFASSLPSEFISSVTHCTAVKSDTLARGTFTQQSEYVPSLWNNFPSFRVGLSVAWCGIQGLWGFPQCVISSLESVD